VESTTGGLRVRSRRGWNMTELVPEVADLPPRLVLDGELIAFGEDGLPSFPRLCARMLHRFWNSFKRDVPPLDVIIDDGGHEPEQQRVTFEELYSHLLPGGVYVCEDVHGSQNDFANYMQTWANGLNYTSQQRTGKRTETNAIQRTVRSVSFYPFMVVVEKHWEPVDELVARKRGDEWLRRKRPSL
jgi:hypothetical protein